MKKSLWLVERYGAPGGCVDIYCRNCFHHVVCPQCDMPTFCGKCGKKMIVEEGEDETNISL